MAIGLLLGAAGPLTLSGADAQPGAQVKSGPILAAPKPAPLPVVVKPAPAAVFEAPVAPARHLAAAAKAKSLLGWKGAAFLVEGRRFRADCAGFVAACYDSAGVNLFSRMPAGKAGEDTACQLLWQRYKARAVTAKNRLPKVGDLVFFDNTWDRNGNRVRDDRLTHVALVDSVAASGVVHCLHFSSGMVKGLSLDPARPLVNQAGGKTVNDWLRRGAPGEKPNPQNLAGALFAAYVTP
ncbi:MAG: CHAP domain-containing protein [Spirochaetes bacterium]|nr:CHAP domain-containing protein [Spirochaetota bacterium]